MAALYPLLSTITLFTLAIQPAAEQWYVVGVKDKWVMTMLPTNGIGYTTHDYSIAVKDMSSGKEEDTKHSGVGRGPSDMCSAGLMGAEVWCTGDVSKDCQGYDVAAYKSRRCRTYCALLGDNRNIYNYNSGTQGTWFRVHLICDKPYP
ncbi:uncharacterized protein F5Z01DRAFT_256912 [Emericellopsis atlantica]|uniref:Uncharacterized protein n=1 Tax=Emericellopsis atlantica TaxID=2614577 RepID=A0A9P8CLQ9_9HYPO|nr:uncharacterized protein F5Z01DRAFT_256912 [Emericellopsis atlantica]KAG9251909.1 hypothetical protein F5Z01DRAFT_256912 [Emericellopsis atlantica]